jgi:hypothetical protein
VQGHQVVFVSLEELDFLEKRIRTKLGTILLNLSIFQVSMRKKLFPWNRSLVRFVENRQLTQHMLSSNLFSFMAVRGFEIIYHEANVDAIRADLTLVWSLDASVSSRNGVYIHWRRSRPNLPRSWHRNCVLH